MPRQYVHVGTRTLSYFDSDPNGEKQRVLVLAHAFPLGAAMWDAQARAMPPGWRLVAPDLRGFGGSPLPLPDDSPSIDDYATDILDVLRALDVPSAVIGGLSMGGYAVFAVLRRAPAVARAVVLADTRMTADTPEGRANRRSMMALVEREGAAGVAREMMPKLLGRTTQSERPDVEPLVRRLIKQQPPEAVRGALARMMDRPDSQAIVRQITVPTLVVVGSEDELTPVDDSKAIVDSIPSATLVVIPHAGHLSNLERPDRFNQALSTFLTGLL